ncbi:GDSL-type esterase/lipase family protein [Mucilaginibacter sp. 10I4]|uniref:GDSL-type esterase/lipase family protein n=1 Tax=Mucilaginibacter sp. 10I4 TaxID=3048580 RepID=UPI002B23ABB0|nr:GDSL-type esterase/lipase family protein [Mucilaginibacter sp. 10I4]MEB0262665.1 GDSL-type esterase/lipase family protein [Mucilaginibacter sp. 10I4]
MKRYVLVISILVNIVFVGLIVRHFVLSPKKTINPPLTYFVNRNVVLAGLPKDTTDVLFVGDSQMQSFDVAEYFKSLKVKNRGVYYDTSLGFCKRAVNIASGHPLQVFIEIGENDLLQSVKLDSIINNVTRGVKTILSISPKTKVYLLSVLPLRKETKSLSHEKPRLQLNGRYKVACQNMGAFFIDLDSYFNLNGLNPAYDVGDGIHLNHAGYMQLYKALKPYTAI